MQPTRQSRNRIEHPRKKSAHPRVSKKPITLLDKSSLHLSGTQKAKMKNNVCRDHRSEKPAYPSVTRNHNRVCIVCSAINTYTQTQLLAHVRWAIKTCMQTQLYVTMYMCMYTHTHMCVCMYTCVCVCMYVHTFSSTHTYLGWSFLHYI
jgi:hypothetical protein